MTRKTCVLLLPFSITGASIFPKRFLNSTEQHYKVNWVVGLQKVICKKYTAKQMFWCKRCIMEEFVICFNLEG